LQHCFGTHFLYFCDQLETSNLFYAGSRKRLTTGFIEEYIYVYATAALQLLSTYSRRQRKTAAGWSISLLVSVLLQRLQGRRASKPVPGTRLRNLESQNHSLAPNPNNAPQSLPG